MGGTKPCLPDVFCSDFWIYSCMDLDLDPNQVLHIGMRYPRKLKSTSMKQMDKSIAVQTCPQSAEGGSKSSLSTAKLRLI